MWLVIAGLVMMAACADDQALDVNPQDPADVAPGDAQLSAEEVDPAPLSRVEADAVPAVARRVIRRAPTHPVHPSGASVACHALPGQADLTSEIVSGTHVVVWDGIDREVIVRVPDRGSGADSPPPVMFNLHPSSSSAVRHDAEYTLSSEAVDRGYVVLVPEGVPPREEGELQVWEFLPDDEHDDLGYLSALVDWIGEGTCIDRERVYASGFSNGGTMAHLVACHSDGRFRAVAAVAAQRFPVSCPSGPISVLGIHGTDDRIVPYTGGQLIRRPDIEMPDVESTYEDWAENGRCGPSVDEQVADDVRVRRWSDCHDDVEVLLYTVFGGDHVWPRSEHPLWPSSIDATTMVLDFFDTH